MNEPIPMLERWRNDPICGEVIRRVEFSDNKKIENKKMALNFMVKEGSITQDEADRRLEALYEELGMLVLQ